MALCEAARGGSSLLWPRVLLFGDSITQFSFQQGGWGASLADKLVRKCDVLNRGFSGYNTRWAKIILPRLIRKGDSLDRPAAVTIFFGANDSALKDENPKQHIPLNEYVANLKSMVQYLKSVDVPEDRIVLITPPPLWEAAWEQECLLQGCKLNRLNSVVGEYAGACLQVAQDCGIDVLDLWTLMQKDTQPPSQPLPGPGPPVVSQARSSRGQHPGSWLRLGWRPSESYSSGPDRTSSVCLLPRRGESSSGTRRAQQTGLLLTSVHRVHSFSLLFHLMSWKVAQADPEWTSHPICQMDCTCHQREMSSCSPTCGL
ncbi:isoamyl acetate-hydrolyzing esterase 1 homolog isoform 4-T4 [Lycaon pictus]